MNGTKHKKACLLVFRNFKESTKGHAAASHSTLALACPFLGSLAESTMTETYRECRLVNRFHPSFHMALHAPCLA